MTDAAAEAVIPPSNDEDLPLYRTPPTGGMRKNDRGPPINKVYKSVERRDLYALAVFAMAYEPTIAYPAPISLNA